MIGRRDVTGLSLLGMLLVCALSAQSALALEVTKSSNTTAFTCRPNIILHEFTDTHCDNYSPDFGPGFNHVAITNTTTEIDTTNAEVTESTKKSAPAVLKGTIGLAKVMIECAIAKSNTKNSITHNVEPEAGKHTYTGTFETEFSTCSVKELAKCVVAEPIVSKAELHGVEGMEGPKGEKNAMGIEFVGEGAEKLFAEVEFKNKGAEACSLNGKRFPITGSVVGTNGPTPESKQDNKHSGSTLVFTPKFKMQTLKLGPNTATFETIATPRMAGGGYPISMTTTT